MPGARWFPGAELNFAEHVFRDKHADQVAVLHASELRELGELRWGELRDQVAEVAAGLRAPGRRARRSRRRLHAEHPRNPRRLPGHGVASARSGRAARPTSAPRAWSTASRRSSPRSCSGRWLPVQRPGLRPARHGGRDRAADPRDRADHRRSLSERLPRARPARGRRPATADDPGTAPRARRGGASALRAGGLRPPVVGALLLRDHRPAEGDSPGTRRDPARAPEEAQPPPRRPGGRPGLLVHHHRLDDVELPGRRPAHAAPRSSSTTGARRIRTWACCGTSPSAPASPASEPAQASSPGA